VAEQRAETRKLAASGAPSKTPLLASPDRPGGLSASGPKDASVRQAAGDSLQSAWAIRTATFEENAMAFDAGLAQRIRDCLHGRPGITERKMFGGMAFMSKGHMFVGVTGEVLMARIGPDAYEHGLSKPHVREMDFTGKPMKGYVYVDAPALESDTDLCHWVETCLRFVSALPPKKTKP
jgi:hypothetical protein